MINTPQDLLTFENIYLLANWGVVPFWLLLIFMPSHAITKFFCQSIIAPLLLALANIFESFKLYLGIEGLGEVYANESLRLVFWLHFLSISLFVGAWIARDSQKYMIPKILLIPSIAFTYFAGPIGIVVYWFVRIFYAKKISFDE